MKTFYIPPSLCRAADAVWPDEQWAYWHRYRNDTANKFASMDRCRIPPACLEVLHCAARSLGSQLPRDAFFDFEFHAAGMHMLPPGGFVRPHLDAQRHPIHNWERVASAVVFVNSHWLPEWGGELQLFHNGALVDKVAPLQGHAAMLDTQDQVHAVADTALDAPPRKTLCLFAWRQCYPEEIEGKSDRSVFVKPE